MTWIWEDDSVWQKLKLFISYHYDYCNLESKYGQLVLATIKFVICLMQYYLSNQVEFQTFTNLYDKCVSVYALFQD